MEKAVILVKRTSEKAILKVHGRGIHANSEEIRRFCTQAIEEDVKRVVFDLAECVGMDSTFMGIIGMLVRIAMPKKCIIEIRNASTANYKNLCSLGLESFFEFTSGDQLEVTQNIEQVEMSEEEKQRNILNAHQELVNLNEANREHFEDIITFLKEQSPE